MTDYLDVDEVECLNKALEGYAGAVQDKKTERHITRLREIFPRGTQHIFEEGKRPFEEFAAHFKKVLRDALNAYCSTTPAPSDLPDAMRILALLEKA